MWEHWPAKHPNREPTIYFSALWNPDQHFIALLDSGMPISAELSHFKTQHLPTANILLLSPVPCGNILQLNPLPTYILHPKPIFLFFLWPLFLILNIVMLSPSEWIAVPTSLIPIYCHREPKNPNKTNWPYNEHPTRERISYSILLTLLSWRIAKLLTLQVCLDPMARASFSGVRSGFTDSCLGTLAGITYTCYLAESLSPASTWQQTSCLII